MNFFDDANIPDIPHNYAIEIKYPDYSGVERKLAQLELDIRGNIRASTNVIYELGKIQNIRRKQSRRSTQLLNARINYRWKIAKSEWLANKNWEKVWKKHQGSVPKKAMTKKEFKKWQEELLTKTK